MRRLGCALLLGCSAAPAPPDIDPGLAELALTEVRPGLLLPGTPVDLVGKSFIPDDEGLATLRMYGTFTPEGGAPREIEVDLPATWVDANHLAIRSGAWMALGGAPGKFAGLAALYVDSALDLRRHAAPQLPFEVALASSLTPRADTVAGGAIFVNHPVVVSGDGFLLGGSEGETRAVVDGCFLPAGETGPCAQKGRTVTGVEIAAEPVTRWDRTRARFPFAPAIAGIHPGGFTGTVRLRNVVPGAPPTASAAVALAATLQRPAIAKFSPSVASLGQFVDITGGGFAGGSPGTVTLVRLEGHFLADGAPMAVPVDLTLVPRFFDGARLRYVIDEADELGRRVNLRGIAGKFSGKARPLVIAGQEQEVGVPSDVELSLAHVKQVVYVGFARSYVDSLGLFGLRFADAAVRARVFAVARRDYAGVNVEFRDTLPDDFALYAHVDILGPDPNNLGLLGYDNTPGKDVGNARLFDRIGGVNAATQEDGFPGYGGVFAVNFLGFSRKPPPEVARLPFDTDAFDAIFDPLRPDRGGKPATSVEIAYAPKLTDGAQCPAADRSVQVACAIFVLGNLVGSTMTHETGHSLGLANPLGDGFHDPGDGRDRLMDAGSDRPFDERAEIGGSGPAMFCEQEFEYLKMILPAPPGSDPRLTRPSCE